MQIFLHLGHGLASAVCWPDGLMGLPFAGLADLWVCRLLTWRSYGSVVCLPGGLMGLPGLLFR